MKWVAFAVSITGIAAILAIAYVMDRYERKLAQKEREIIFLKDDLLRRKDTLPRHARDIDWQD